MSGQDAASHCTHLGALAASRRANQNDVLRLRLLNPTLQPVAPGAETVGSPVVRQGGRPREGAPHALGQQIERRDFGERHFGPGVAQSVHSRHVVWGIGMLGGAIERVASGEGGSRSSTSSLPVDIPYSKVVEWLIERRVVPSTWQRSLRTAHAKLESALEEERPPVPGMDVLVPAGRSAENTTYFECARVVALLKEAGLAEKNFLGSYTNAHTARWADVVKRYETGQVYLIGAAQYLIHHVAYELPAIKKDIGRAERELTELQRRQTEYVRMAEASQVRYAEGCTKKRIPEGERHQIRQQLRSSLCQLRPLYDSAVRLAQRAPVVAACAAYKELVAFSRAKAAETLQSDGAQANAKESRAKQGKHSAVVDACPEPTGEMLSTLSRLQALDLSSVPLTSEGGPAPDGHGSLSVQDGDGSAAAIDIDWGGSGGGGVENCGPAAAGIDWGDTAGNAGELGGAAAVEIDWGGQMEVAGGDGHVVDIDWGESSGGAVGGGAVDWGDSIGIEVGEASAFEFEIEVEAGGDGASAEELSLAAIFEDHTTRNQLVDDLMELQGFLTQHATELKVSGAAAALPHALQLDSSEVEARLAAVNEVLAVLEDGHTKHLLLLSTSDKYVERQAHILEQMLDHADKMHRRAEELKTRQAELMLLIEAAHPKYDATVDAIRRTKEEFESALSKHLDGRRVNLMGDINNL